MDPLLAVQALQRRSTNASLQRRGAVVQAVRVPPARMMRWRCGSSGLPARVAVTSIAPCNKPNDEVCLRWCKACNLRSDASRPHCCSTDAALS